MFFSINDIQLLEKELGVKQEYSEIEKKYIQKAQSFSRFLGLIPGILLVALGNSLSMKSGSKESDIDLFIVCHENRMWTVRIFVTLIAAITRQRKNHKHHAGKICLSFFCTPSALNFSTFAIQQDIYLFYRVLNCKPLININHTYEIFIDQNNWANFNDFPQYTEQSQQFLVRSGNTQVSLSYFGDILENILKSVFLRRTMTKKKQMGDPFGVIVDDTMLKFHDKDARRKIRDAIFAQKPGKNTKAA